MVFDLIFIWLGLMLVYFSWKWAFLNENFFKHRGVLYEKPLPIFGNVINFALRKRNMNLILSDLYKKYKNAR
jgi:cytochrome P450 family 9